MSSKTKSKFCQDCGNKINLKDSFCSDCGANLDGSPDAYISSSRSIEDSFSITMGLLSIFTGWYIPILGLILGVLGFIRTKTLQNEEGNKSITVGEVLSVIGVVVSIIAWIYWFDQGVYVQY